VQPLWLLAMSLSIPLTWDFSLNPRISPVFVGFCMCTFNSPYLGFFLEPPEPRLRIRARQTFQFPLLGIFPWTHAQTYPANRLGWTFNSPYLGFFLEPYSAGVRQPS